MPRPLSPKIALLPLLRSMSRRALLRDPERTWWWMEPGSSGPSPTLQKLRASWILEMESGRTESRPCRSLTPRSVATAVRVS